MVAHSFCSGEGVVHAYFAREGGIVAELVNSSANSPILLLSDTFMILD
jgi:hypothetical protein